MSRPFAHLVAKDWRQLWSARATILLAIAIGPLVGHTFLSAAEVFAEVSGSAGGPAALSQGLSPLDGLVVPTFGAYAIAATLLLPFVAIRLLSADKDSGVLRLLLQSRATIPAMIVAKLVVMLGAWLVMWLPGLLALAIWAGRGGHLYAPEVVTVLAGHLLYAGIVTGIAFLAAAVTDGAATAAVVALAVTLGGWALDFVAEVKGGIAARIAAFTPDALLRTFEHGEVSVAVTAVAVLAILALLVLAMVSIHPGWSLPRRVRLAGGVIVAAVVLIGAGGRSYGSWDTTEDQRNSLAVEDQHALRALHAPLRILVYLAPEDPRLTDLKRDVLHKLQRVVRHVDITYGANSSTGLFEKPGAHYGEVWYSVGGRRAMSRSTADDVVLDTIYAVAGIPPPATRTPSAYPGYPLRTTPSPGIAILFGLIFPLATMQGWRWWRRRTLRK